MANALAQSPCIRTIGKIDLSLQHNRTLNVINRSKYNGAALTHAVYKLIPTASNQVVLSNESLPLQHAHRSRQEIRVIFRSPATSLGPHLAVNTVLHRLLGIRNLHSNTSVRTHTTRLLRLIRLPTAILAQQPHRLSNNRERQVNVTQTLTIRPRILITSRTIDTLSISAGTTIVALLSQLHSRLNLTLVFVSRSLKAIQTIYSHITIVCLNHVIRRNAASTLCSSPRRPCAQTLLGTTPQVGSAQQPKSTQLPNRPPDPLSPPAKYTFRPQYTLTTRPYQSRRPRIHSRNNRATVYRFT